MRHRSVPVLLALAGACWTAGQAVLPDIGLAWDDRLAAVVEAPGRQAGGTALLLLAGSLLVCAAVAAARVPRSGRGARLVTTGTFLLGLGGVWLAAGRGAFSLAMGRVAEADVPAASALAVLESEGGPEFLALLPCLPALLVGPVLLAVGLQRAGVPGGPVGWLPLVLWIGGVGTFVATEFTVKVGEVAGVGLASVALVLLGLGLAREHGSAEGPRQRPRTRKKDQPEEAVPALGVGRTIFTR